jgi:hypothetical protein
MKYLFFLAFGIGLLPESALLLKAQNNVKLERETPITKHSISLKFIDGIELTAQEVTNTIRIVEEKVKLNPINNPHSPVTIANPTENIESCTSLQFKFAMLMDKEVESIKNFSLYNFINEWWATRYRYGGTDLNGIDCSAFTEKLVSKVYGLPLPRTSKDQFNQCMKIATTDLLEGDLVFFNTSGGISHVGVYLGNNYFVHSSVRDGVTISSLMEEYYNNKFITGGRISLTP